MHSSCRTVAWRCRSTILRALSRCPCSRTPASAPKFLAGFFDFRGTPVAALRLDLLLSLGEERYGIYSPLLILKEASPPVALHVGRVTGDHQGRGRRGAADRHGRDIQRLRRRARHRSRRDRLRAVDRRHPARRGARAASPRTANCASSASRPWPERRRRWPMLPKSPQATFPLEADPVFEELKSFLVQRDRQLPPVGQELAGPGEGPQPPAAKRPVVARRLSRPPQGRRGRQARTRQPDRRADRRRDLLLPPSGSFRRAARPCPAGLPGAQRASRQLRIWSAGCANGAEAYSIAILVHSILGDRLKDWNVTIVGSDINRAFLAEAEAGIYTAWTLRGVPKEQAARLLRAQRRSTGRCATNTSRTSISSITTSSTRRFRRSTRTSSRSTSSFAAT